MTLNVGVEGAETWMPAESDVSIRPGWYWSRNTNNRVKTVDQLLEIYYASVGHNTNLLLNFPVDKRGLVHENDAQRLRELSTILPRHFAMIWPAIGRQKPQTSAATMPNSRLAI